MWQAFYAGNDRVSYALVALVFFVGFFAAVVLFVSRRRHDRRFDALAALPFTDTPATPAIADPSPRTAP